MDGKIIKEKKERDRYSLVDFGDGKTGYLLEWGKKPSFRRAREELSVWVWSPGALSVHGLANMPEQYLQGHSRNVLGRE